MKHLTSKLLIVSFRAKACAQLTCSDIAIVRRRIQLIQRKRERIGGAAKSSNSDVSVYSRFSYSVRRIEKKITPSSKNVGAFRCEASEASYSVLY